MSEFNKSHACSWRAHLLAERPYSENGYLAPEHSIRCPPSSDALGPGSGDTLDGQRCAVNLLGAWIDTASFSLFVYSASVALQAIGVISLGALADHRSYLDSQWRTSRSGQHSNYTNHPQLALDTDSSPPLPPPEHYSHSPSHFFLRRHLSGSSQPSSPSART